MCVCSVDPWLGTRSLCLNGLVDVLAAVHSSDITLWAAVPDPGQCVAGTRW